jgi:hypothetical protein
VNIFGSNPDAKTVQVSASKPSMYEVILMKSVGSAVGGDKIDINPIENSVFIAKSRTFVSTILPGEAKVHTRDAEIYED